MSVLVLIGLFVPGFFLAWGLLQAWRGGQNPPPPVAPALAAGRFQTMADGTRIYIFTYNPLFRHRRTIYVVAGITGISHPREMDLVRALSGEENRVVVIHPRGTGYSGGPRGDVRDFQALLDDYLAVINGDDLSGRRCLFGHSMSAAMAVAIADRVRDLCGVVLVNPPVRLQSSAGMTPTPGDYVNYALHYLFAPHRPVVNMAGDPDRIGNPDERREAQERGDDPLLVKYFSIRCMMNSKKLMDAMVETAPRQRVPLLLAYGTADSLVDEAGCRELFASWGDVRKRYLRVERGPHGKQTVLKAQEAIRNWIRARDAGAEEKSGSPAA